MGSCALRNGHESTSTSGKDVQRLTPLVIGVPFRTVPLSSFSPLLSLPLLLLMLLGY